MHFINLLLIVLVQVAMVTAKPKRAPKKINARQLRQKLTGLRRESRASYGKLFYWPQLKHHIDWLLKLLANHLYAQIQLKFLRFWSSIFIRKLIFVLRIKPLIYASVQSIFQPLNLCFLKSFKLKLNTVHFTADQKCFRKILKPCLSSILFCVYLG